ncbi:hypothetical protein AJ78_06803 [Emergomyces pasteurianus Ep9510]|uniref:NAD(P)-binding protein n=1 Tax=Emergomyces pasteurianus Ep9510 TaxID=1447872 RepID=A0A1J9Q8X7_9EURO|nr:hypothetical protein AJ78_06803 [Emergomyces pasteurianus Ep9510]
MEPFTIPRSSLASLTNKTTLITGGSSGIGLATAELLLSLSPTNNVVILDLQSPSSTSKLLITSPENAHRTHFHKCNIASWPEQRAGFAAAISRFGRIDAVFVNAGIAEYGDQFFNDEMEGKKGGLERFRMLKEPDRRVVDIDLRAAADTLKLAIYWMRKKVVGMDGKKGGVGSIIMTASLAGYLADGGAPAYSAAKHGIVGLLRSLKNDVAKLNIALSVVAPAITLTPIITSSGRKTRTSSDPAEWAASMMERGLAINKPETVALAVAHLINIGMQANGQGLLLQKDMMVDVERGLAKSREVWMGKEMLAWFKGGSNALKAQSKL